ncbi:MAG TPA: metallopeptidase family protein, partial [Labilithrix sp.]|nr:metallopeptidase family protein [Labilithrix sp.]
PGERVELVVESGTPDVDDGGEPLLGSYVPPPPRGAPVPTHPPKVTIYYRTFERIEQEEGRFDWEAELRETIEHELEHHVFWLRGDDPMADEEHAEIDREVVRVIGRGESTRRTLAVFGLSFGEFVRRAWLFIVLAALAFAIWFAEGRCGATSLD